MKKIITHKLRESDVESLTHGLENYPHFSLVQEDNFKKLLQMDLTNVAGCFIFVDESLKEGEFESFLNYFHGTSINVILKYKDFDALMVCHKYQVHSVFEAKLTKTELENTLVKTDLLAVKPESLPVLEVMDLISSPVTVKTNYELYHSVANYLQSFDGVQGFCLVECTEEESNVIGDYDASSILNEIKKIKLPRKYIGSEEIVKKGDLIEVITPVFCPEEQSVWLVVSMKERDRSFILNSLFYKYLENVLIYRMNKKKEQNLELLASTDDVTGLFNQRQLSKDLEEAVKHHEKHDKNFSIMFLDVDHFKSVNDNYGHVVGSKLLTDIGEVLSLILRASDHIYRYGGDEFVVIMPTVDIGTVHEIASRVLEKVKNKNFDIGNGETFSLSVSIGIAEYPTDARSAIEIIRFADEMMYMSKRSGRGKVFHINEVDHADASSE